MNLKNEKKQKTVHSKTAYIICLFFLIIPIIAKAQFFTTGEDPAFIKWNQINTSDFRIIYPVSFQKEADHLATVMEYIYKNVYQSYHHKPGKITVVLHTYSSTSNGFVTWAPKRMELFTTPPQNSYAQNWLDQLAVHEMRHVVQLDNLNHGMSYILSYIFGEQVVGALSGFIPPWIFEGDAVNNETALTSTGRGRDATFEMVMKAQITSNSRIFSYDKASLGSYKDFTPNRYYLGYPMVAWSRKTFKASTQDSATNFFGHYPNAMLNFPLGIYQFTSKNASGLYQIAFLDMKQKWLTQIETLQVDHNQEQWNVRKSKDFTNYQLPQIVDDTTIVVLKKGIDQLPEFILLNKNGSEKKLTKPGNFADDKLSYSKGNIVWAEEIPDLRWANRSYYCIKKYNLKNNKTTTLTHHTRYFAPSLSPDGNKIAAVEITTTNEFSIVILNTEDGKVLQSIPSPNNLWLQLPTWNNAGTSLYILATTKEGKTILEANLSHGTFETLTKPTFHNIGLPNDASEYILFEGEFTGIPNIYAIRKTDHSLWQVTNEKFGAFAPSLISENKLLYTSYSEKGYNVVSTLFRADQFIALEKSNQLTENLSSKSAQLEHFNFQDSTINPKKFSVSSYSKSLHLFNFHSWAPFYVEYDNLNIVSNNLAPGISLLSQNHLSTMISTFGYKYENGYSYEQVNFTYSGWFPKVNVILNYGGPVPISKPANIASHQQTNDYFSADSRIYLPLNLTNGSVNSGFTPGIEMKYESIWLYDQNKKNYNNNFTQISYYLTIYSLQSLSARDLHAPWGFILSAKLLTSPFNQNYGDLSFIKSYIYTPGILKHHSLKISNAFQYQKKSYYSTQIAFPRGLYSETTQNLITASIDYEFPFWYPDLSIGPLFYVKRFRANIFFDAARNQYTYNKLQTTEYLKTTGLDITADFHVLRLIFPLNAGIRTIYDPQLTNFTYEFLFTIDLNSL